MTRDRMLATLLLPALLASGCVATTTTTRTWGGPGDDWARYGRVETIRETVQRTEGNPAGGAVAGALVGALVGSALGGHVSYDRWGRAYHHGSGAGAVVGAIGGAAVGAAASSQPAGESRTYELFVRFEDGAVERFVYAGVPPFATGDTVVQTARGLERG